MKRLCWLIGLLVIGISTGCNSDIVTNPGLKKLDHKCVYLSSIESDNPNVGKVIKNIIEKEFMRKKIELCDFDTATVLITGAAFMTARSTSSGSFLGRSSTSTQAIESVSVVAKDRNGLVLLSASYDNRDRYSASKLAREFGAALADKLK